MGKAALEGQEGIRKIEKGFYNFMEINTVYYDPSKITVEKMENLLRKAETYKRTIRKK